MFFQKVGIESARLDAEILISHGLGLRRIDLYLKHDQPLSEDELKCLRDFVKRRSQLEPVAYLIQKKEFYGHEFKVTPAVLIPRPETEFVVDAAVEFLKKIENPRVADWGCGSGCIGLSILKTVANSNLFSVDISAEALEIAKINSQTLGVGDRCQWSLGSIESVTQSSQSPWDQLNHQLDIIVANPPYIEKGDPNLSSAVEKFEPHVALFADEKGMGAIRRWSEIALEYLNPNHGVLALEIGFGQAANVTQTLREIGYNQIKIRKDYSNVDRVVIARRE